MPKLSRHAPSYRLHKPSNRALVTLDGHDYYLGTYNSPESKEEYDRLIAEWLGNGRKSPRSPDASPADLTVTELLARFFRHAETHYRTPDGKPSRELDNYRDSVRPLRATFGSLEARDFSPLKLKRLRQSLIDSGLARTTINQRIGRIVHLYKWAVSEELVPESVHTALKSVVGLQKGRTEAKETDPVGPVPDAHVDAIALHVARQVWAMIELQRLTGMRPGEVVIMRTCDLTTTSDVWEFVPARHKMSYKERPRRVFLGSRAQAVLKPWLKTDLTAYLFSPGEARAERFAALRAGRKSKVQPSQRDRSKPGAKRRPGVRYTTQTYYHAIQAACEKAGIPKWHPHQLRHSAATLLEKEFGLDVSRAILGHGDLKTTTRYVEQDYTKAREAMAQVG